MAIANSPEESTPDADLAAAGQESTDVHHRCGCPEDEQTTTAASTDAGAVDAGTADSGTTSGATETVAAGDGDEAVVVVPVQPAAGPGSYRSVVERTSVIP